MAVLSDTFESYQRGIVHHIGSRLHAAGYGTLCITARDLRDQDVMFDRTRRRVAHPLATCLDVSGSIILSPLVARGFSEDELTLFFATLSERPVVSIGAAHSTVPSVCLSSARALDQLMEHMTRDPARRRFVFIRGYVDDPDTREREAAFRRGLRVRGIPVDERLIVEGHYASSVAFTAIDELLRDGIRFDAVVSANDDMAAIAITALERHGLSVPEDVIVSGFDDHSIAIEMSAPLTTIRNFLERQSIAAADLLLEQLDSDDCRVSVRSSTLEAELIVRASSDTSLDGPNHRVGPSHGDGSARSLRDSGSVRQFGEQLVHDLSHLHVPPGSDAKALAASLYDTFNEGGDALWLELRRQLDACPVDAFTSRWWLSVERQLRELVDALPIDGAHGRAVARTYEAVSRLDGHLRSVKATMQFDVFADRQRHEKLLMRLAATSRHDAIWTLLREEFGALGLERAWVALDIGDSSVPPSPMDIGGETTVRLVFALDDAHSPHIGTSFVTREILPAGLRDELAKGVLVLCPLRTSDIELGFLIVDAVDCATLELSAIAAGLSLALRQVHQMGDLKRRAEQLRLANTTLSTVARYDSLTGLPNRVLFHENLGVAFRRADAAGHQVALLFIDLDGFKLINDTLGHSAGDHLLRIVASRVGGVLRSGDSLSRLGGDEFTIIAAQGPTDATAVRIAEDVLATVARPCRLGERVVNISASIGVACYPDDGNDAETLIRNADTAMYRAKGRGKSRFAVYDDAMNREAMAELELRDDLRRGLQKREFRMHYQPRIDLARGRLTGFEALIRWREGVGPAAFIPVAEQSGLIAALDAFSLDSACKQASLWQARGLTAQVSVNLSVRRLQEVDIVEQVTQALRKHRLSPDLLELEITESAAMSDIEDNIVKLGALQSLGVSIAIDDFGTGYSSLNYLRRLPINSLKVDRSFLSGIESNADAVESADAAIVRAVVALGASLGFRIVAEGVENEAQLIFLRSLGCDEGQGYLFSRPLAVPAATEYLIADRSMDADRHRFGA